MQATAAEKSLKKLLHIERSTDRHWVGNGFPVRTLFTYSNLGSVLSPFLLLDYVEPTEFDPTRERRGVGEHPHRGFETVTIVYAGEVDHRDSAGGGGSIGPGDVQWMTAASGIVHEELHGRNFARLGGPFEMVQLWVNLPAKDKMGPPGYQSILSSHIPVVELPDDQGTVRVIAGEFAGTQGPAKTHTPIHIWDLRLNTRQSLDLTVPEGYTALLVIRQGATRLQDGTALHAAEVGMFDRGGNTLRLDTAEHLNALLLLGEPLDEPIVGRGPFVMNTAQEIHQALADYQSGKMGRLSAAPREPEISP